jgi:hypothetical protein
MPQLTIDYLTKYSKKNNFIESGTYQGDTVKTAIEYGFKNIHSIEIFDTLYDKYATMIQENKNYQNKSEMRIVIKAIMSILVLYSSLVENKEFERVFYERIMNLEPLLILINDMKSEFQTILFGYAETANAAHSPVIGTHASLNEINLF